MSGPARFLYTMTDCSLRTAQVEDCERIYQFIQELAVSEDRKDEVMITPEDLRENGFGKDKLFYVLVAEMPLENPESGQKKMVGFLLYQYFYNSHFGKLLFVQDIFVRPENRSCGIGSLLWKEVMRICLRDNCSGLQWHVRKFNELAIKFYKKYGGVNVTDREDLFLFEIMSSQIQFVLEK